MSGIKVKEIGKYVVTVSEYNGHFTATKGKTKLEAETLAKLEELIKRQESTDRHFKPIAVIEVESGTVGRITSRVADNDRDVYFTHKPHDDLNEKAVRRSANLDGWQKGEHHFVVATEANLAIVAKIKEVEADIKTKYDLIGSFKKQYTEPVTWKMIEAGEDSAAKGGA